MTAKNVMTLESFLLEYSLCRLWYASVGSPAGVTVAVSDQDDGDNGSVVECLDAMTGRADASEIDGVVTQDADGEWRWDVRSLTDANVRDCNRNTVYNLVLWSTR